MPVEIVAESENFKQYKGEGIYPDNVQTVSLFIDMLTQWRVGVNGATGFDYKALPVVFKMRGVKKKNREEVFNGLQVMERAALKVMREK